MAGAMGRARRGAAGERGEFARVEARRSNPRVLPSLAQRARSVSPGYRTLNYGWALGSHHMRFADSPVTFAGNREHGPAGTTCR